MTLGGGTKARGGMSNSELRLAAAIAASTDEPAVGVRARRRGEALGDLALEHQRQALIGADAVEPASSSGVAML